MTNVLCALDTKLKTDPKIRVEDVSKDFVQNGRTLSALKNVDLYAGDGELVSIIGPSGCGKSTLLNVIAGLDEPIDGQRQLRLAVEGVGVLQPVVPRHHQYMLVHEREAKLSRVERPSRGLNRRHLPRRSCCAVVIVSGIGSLAHAGTGLPLPTADPRGGGAHVF